MLDRMTYASTCAQNANSEKAWNIFLSGARKVPSDTDVSYWRKADIHS